MKRIQAASCVRDAITLQRTAYRSSRALTTSLRCPSSTPLTRRNTPNSTSSLLKYRSNSHLLTLTRQYASSTTPESAASPGSSETPTPQSPKIKKTPLYDFHVQQGGKMVPFAGFYMPVEYASQSLSESHHFTRTQASIFDVSHMVQRRFWGPEVNEFLEKITPAGIKELPEGKSTLSVLLNDEGGIVDDCIITRLGPTLFNVVTNAGCRDQDSKFFLKEHRNWTASGRERVTSKVMDNRRSLFAIQGPGSAEILKELLVPAKDGEEEFDLKNLLFGEWKIMTYQSKTNPELRTPVDVSRGGYTGEDGFELSTWRRQLVPIVEDLLKTAGPEKLRLAGLGARDSLRLEAGMCLYGHDLNETITPVEAGLSWIIGKDRRETGGFNGAGKILKQLVPKSKGGTGVERRRVGLIVQGPPAREGAEIVDEKGEKIGVVTSGCPSPTLGKNIAMGYIQDGFHKSGTNVEVVVRGKNRKAEVTKMPFVPTKYWKGETAV